MTRTRAVLLVVLAVLSSVWASLSWTVPAAPGSARRGAQAAPDPARVPPVFDLEVNTARLAARKRPAPTPGGSGRNPFRFATDRRAPDEPEPARPLVTPPDAVAPVAPAVPAVSLIGIVDRTVDGKPIRLAVLSMSDTLHYVSAGQVVGSRYKVVAVSAEGVELADVTDGSTRRLALR